MSPAREESTRGLETRAAPVGVRVICLAGLAAGALGLMWIGGRAAAGGWPDFEYFYKAGASLLERGGLDPGYDVSLAGQVTERGSIPWYLPFVSRIMTLVAWLPQKQAGLVWLVLNVAAMFATLRLVGRHLVSLPPQDWPVTQLVPFFVLFLFWWWEFRLNQINNLTLLLLLGGFVCWQRGQHRASGLWLGLAVLIKVTPALLLVWFALKRQYRVVGLALLTIVLAGPMGDLAVFGPARTVDSYRSWFERAVADGSQRGLILSQRELDWRNQGLGAVASRWLHATDYSTRFDNEPRFGGDNVERTINVVNLSRVNVARIVMAIQGLSLVALVWLARRPAGRLSSWRLRLEWALFLMAMLWFMPVMRAYHVIWAYPAVAVLAGAVHYHGLRHWWSLMTLATLALAAAVQVMSAVPAEGALPWLPPHAGGVILAVVVALAVPTIVLTLRIGRGQAKLPDKSRARTARRPGD